MHDQAACYRAKVYTAETEAVIFLNDLSLHRPCHGDLLLLDVRFQSLFKGSKGERACAAAFDISRAGVRVINEAYTSQPLEQVPAVAAGMAQWAVSD